MQGKNVGISADAAAAIDKKDRRIDQLQNEMMVMLKDKNKDSDTQVQLYREKALLEEHLAKKTSACEGFSQLISQQESIIERLKESAKSNEYAIKNLEDEHKALHLESVVPAYLPPSHPCVLLQCAKFADSYGCLMY